MGQGHGSLSLYLANDREQSCAGRRVELSRIECRVGIRISGFEPCLNDSLILRLIKRPLQVVVCRRKGFLVEVTHQLARVEQSILIDIKARKHRVPSGFRLGEIYCPVIIPVQALRSCLYCVERRGGREYADRARSNQDCRPSTALPNHHRFSR
jgi:hypothetical protein